MFDRAQCSIGQVPSQRLAPAIEAASDLGIAESFSWFSPTPVQDVLGIQDPLVHALDLRQGLCPGDPLGHNRLKASHFLGHKRAHRPLFSSRSRLASTSSNASAAATAGYWNGNVPSKFSAVSTPRA